MASATIAGHAGGVGSQCSSAASTSARPRCRNASRVSATSPARERVGRGLQLAALVEDLDALLGGLEARVAEARELHAAFVQRERLLEREIAVLELLDDRLEFGDRRFEVLDGRVGHEVFVTLASISPRLKVTAIASPGWTAEASRSTRVLAAFHATA